MFKFRSKQAPRSSVSPELDVLSNAAAECVGGSSDLQSGCRNGQGDSITESRFTVLPPTTMKDEGYDALSSSHQHQPFHPSRMERRGSGSGEIGSLVGGKVVVDRKRKERHESTSQGQEKKVIRSAVSDDETLTDPDRNIDFRRTLSHDSFNQSKQKENQFLSGMRKPMGQDLAELAGKAAAAAATSPGEVKVDPRTDGTGNLMMSAVPQIDVMRKINASENYEAELQRQLERSANWSTIPPPAKKNHQHKRRHRSSHSKRQSRMDAKQEEDEQEALMVEVVESVECEDVELNSPSSESTSESKDSQVLPEVEGERRELVPTVEIDEAEDETSQTSDRLMALDFSSAQAQQHQQQQDLHRGNAILAQLGGTSADDEVMLSPRNSVLGKEGIDIPPTPPTYQTLMDPPISRQGYLEGNPVQKMNELSRQITALKRQLKTLESEYEQVYGYRPSHSDKLNSKEMRKCVLQLTKAKKELKEIREDPSCLHTMASVSGGVAGILCVSSGNSIIPTKGTPEYAKYLESTVREIEKTLSDKRRVSNRPDDLERMTPSELQDEKCVMQRQLLVLEKRHGRPSSKQEKDIVRPLYERYRAIKRFSVKVVCVREASLDLVPIIEGETLELNEEPVGIRANVSNDVWGQSPQMQNANANNDTEEESGDDSNDYNRMTLGELETRVRQVKDEKRRMRATIRKFETEFQNVTGRPPQKEEKYSASDMESVYQKYKRTKATIRLLDVLINKRKVPALITDVNHNED